MVEEADIVVLALERPDLTLDEGVEFAEIRRDLRGNVEIHGPFLRANALIDGFSPAILGATPVDAEAAAATLCRPANRFAAVTSAALADQRQADATAEIRRGPCSDRE